MNILKTEGKDTTKWEKFNTRLVKFLKEEEMRFKTNVK